MPGRMQFAYLQSAREPLTARSSSGQPFPIEGPEPPGEHREQRRAGSMPQTPEERRLRLQWGKRAYCPVYECVEVGTEPRAGSREQTVGVRPRNGDEAEDLEQL